MKIINMLRRTGGIVVWCLFVSITLLATEISRAAVIEKKSFSRTRDGIVTVGELLPDSVGEKIKNLRLYAYNNGKLKPIPYQIDELTPDRKTYILPMGPKANTKDGDGLLSPQDELVFMAFDIGDKAPKEAWIGNYRKAEEIEISDPLKPGKGWVYLFSFDKPPPRAKGDYVRWDNKNEEIVTRIYTNGYTPGSEDIHFTKLVSNKPTGGGVDFIDRLKIRMHFEVAIPPLKISFNEEDTGMETYRYKDGPIRVIRLARIFFRLLKKIKIPAGQVMEIYYESYGQGPTIFELPASVKMLLKVWIMDVGVDLSPEAYGMTFYSSANLQGVTVDGKMSPREKNFNLGPSDWHAVTGKIGTYLSRLLSDAPSKKNNANRYCDDISKPDPPEEYPGCVGFFGSWENFIEKPAGKIHTSVLFYMPPPNFKPGDQVEFLNIEDHPPFITVGKKKGRSRSLPWHPRLPKEYFLSQK